MMNNPDAINGLFETFGGIAIFGHVRAILRDKAVQGLNPIACVFFTSWGYWNLYYYPHLDQWLSFIGGLLIVAGNTWWVALILKYRRPETVSPVQEP